MGSTGYRSARLSSSADLRPATSPHPPSPLEVYQEPGPPPAKKKKSLAIRLGDEIGRVAGAPVQRARPPRRLWPNGPGTPQGGGDFVRRRRGGRLAACARPFALRRGEAGKGV